MIVSGHVPDDGEQSWFHGGNADSSPVRDLSSAEHDPLGKGHQITPTRNPDDRAHISGRDVPTHRFCIGRGHSSSSRNQTPIGLSHLHEPFAAVQDQQSP